MKIIVSALSVLVAILVFAPLGAAQNSPQTKQEQTEEQKFEEEIREMGRELSHLMVESLKAFLEQEMKKLKKDKGEVKSLAQIPVYEEALKKNPKDADAHIALGSVYAEMGDGANAIIHTKKAEELFLAKKNVKGAAEARRNLRSYYERYGFKAEDFNISK